jgi:hypothetical protein
MIRACRVRSPLLGIVRIRKKLGGARRGDGRRRRGGAIRGVVGWVHFLGMVDSDCALNLLICLVGAKSADSSENQLKSLRIRTDFDSKIRRFGSFRPERPNRSRLSHSTRGPIAPQMATISECRCRWLRVPATKLIKNPNNLNRLLGFSFSAAIDPKYINDLACRFKSPRNHTRNRIRARNLAAKLSAYRGVDIS